MCLSWSRGRAMQDTAGRPIGAARPKLLHLLPHADAQPTAQTPLMLVGGRPGLHLWLSEDGAKSWRAFNVAAEHNRKASEQLQFCPAVVAGTPANASEYFSPYQTGSCECRCYFCFMCKSGSEFWLSFFATPPLLAT